MAYPAGNVEIENALDGVHGGFIGRDEKRGIACAEDQQGDERCDCDACLHSCGLYLDP